MKLSKKQEEILNKMQPEKWYCAYDLQCSIATLEALAAKGIIEKTYSAGYYVYPRIGLLYMKHAIK